MDDVRRERTTNDMRGEDTERNRGRGVRISTVRGSCESRLFPCTFEIWGQDGLQNIMAKHSDVHLIRINMAPQTKPQQEALQFPCPVSFLPSSKKRHSRPRIEV